MQKFNLIKSISSEQLTESDFLRRMIGLKPKKKDEPQSPPPLSKDFSANANMSTDISLLERFVGEVKQAATGKDRVVLSIPTASFQLFMTGEKSSGKAHIDELRSDRDGMVIKNAALGFANEKVQDVKNAEPMTVYRLKKGYKFSKLVAHANEDLMIILDVPTVLTKALEEYGHALKDDSLKLDLKKDLIDKSADVLGKMMHHAFYKMTLSTPKARKIQAAVDAVWDDAEELQKVLNPAIISHYRSRADKRAMIEEFNDLKRDEPQSQDDDLDRDREDDKPTRPVPTRPVPTEPRDENAEIAMIATKLNALKSSARNLSPEDQKALADSVKKVLNYMNNGTLEDD